MWYLTSENDPRVIYVLPFKQITIGRSQDGQLCNFAIPDDASISRKHATLDNGGNHLILQDLGSRYGTFVNNSTEKVDSNVPIQLKEKDVIKFGKLNNLWIINKASFVTCTSTLKGESLQNLKTSLNKLGGTLKNEWDDSCCYLTMPAITLTIKVVLALVQGSQIVTTEFWSHCMAAVDTNQPLPDPKNYTPSIVESTLNRDVVSFNPDARRKSLFNGKKIVFFSKKLFDMYKTVLTNSSGTPILLSDSKMTKSMLSEQDVIVVQSKILNSESQVIANQVNDIVSYLQNNNKRVVADAEIGLAVLYCNTEKYCNPNFNYTSEVMKQSSNQGNKPTNILAQETQENQAVSKRENVIINESLVTENVDVNNSSNNSFKRKHSDDITENSQKKFAAAKATIFNSANKRKNEDKTEDHPNKKIAGTDNNDDDVFNFVNPSTNNGGNEDKGLGKKLNLSKPQKRKQDSMLDNEDDIFNFIEDKNKTNENGSKNNIFNVMMKKSRMETKDEIEEEEAPIVIKKEVEEIIDISAMRGRKLEELMKSNLEMNSSAIHKVKKEKEEDDDLDSRMNRLDLGTTIVIIDNDLIVKKEPVVIDSEINSGGKNFKKFKKVWPLKMKGSLSAASKAEDQFQSGRGETCSQIY